MKTKQELDALKVNWLADPCWDIEDTEGFEEHKTELLAWRIVYQRRQSDMEQGRLEGLCVKYDINMSLLKYIEELEHRIEKLEN